MILLEKGGGCWYSVRRGERLDGIARYCGCVSNIMLLWLLIFYRLLTMVPDFINISLTVLNKNICNLLLTYINHIVTSCTIFE